MESNEPEITPEQWRVYFQDKILDAPHKILDKVTCYSLELPDNDGAIDEQEYLDKFKADDLFNGNAQMAIDSRHLNKDARMSQDERVKPYEDIIISHRNSSPGHHLFTKWYKDING